MILNYAICFPEKLRRLACWNSGLAIGPLAYLSKLILMLETAFRDVNKLSLIAKRLAFDAWNKRFRPNRTDFDWLSNYQTQADHYVEDPFCDFSVSLGGWRDIMDTVFFSIKNLHKIPLNLPIFILGGARDARTNFGRDMTKLCERLTALGNKQLTCKILN